MKNIRVLALIHAVCLLTDLEAFTSNDYYILNSSMTLKLLYRFFSSDYGSLPPAELLGILTNPSTQQIASSARNLGITISYPLAFTAFDMVMS